MWRFATYIAENGNTFSAPLGRANPNPDSMSVSAVWVLN